MPVVVRVLMVAAVALVASACAPTLADFQSRCSLWGFQPGTPDFAGCVERAQARHSEAVGAAIDSMNQSIQNTNRQIQQQNLQNQMLYQMQRPRTCYSSRYSTTCY